VAQGNRRRRAGDSTVSAESKGRGSRKGRGGCPALCVVRRACSTTWRCKSSPNLMEVKGSEPQRHHGDEVSGGSGEPTHEPRNTNRMRGVSVGRASNRSRSPYPSRTRSVNSAGACRPWSSLSREIWDVSRSRDCTRCEPRDGIPEVSRGHSRREPKARTVNRDSRTRLSWMPRDRKSSCPWPSTRERRVKLVHTCRKGSNHRRRDAPRTAQHQPR